MRTTILIAAATAMLAGCDDGTSDDPARPIVVRSAVQNDLHNLSELNQKIAMRRAIFDAGAVCQRVEEAGYVQEYGNLSMWTATCSDGYRWAIFVAPDGTAQLRRCEHVEQLDLPRCEISRRAEPAAPGSEVADNGAEAAPTP